MTTAYFWIGPVAVLAAAAGCGTQVSTVLSTTDGSIDSSTSDAELPRDNGVSPDSAVDAASDGTVTDGGGDGAEACADGGGRAPDADCDPFEVVCADQAGADAVADGALFFTVQSTGCACGGPARACSASVDLAAAMTVQDKCAAVVSGINSACGAGVAQAGFMADGSNCASGSFTVMDPSCAGVTGGAGGVALVLANGRSTLQDAGFVADFAAYIMSACPATEGTMAMLAGTARSIAIFGTSPNVVPHVTAPDKGPVGGTVNTTSGMTSAAIVAQAVDAVNRGLSAIASSVRCAADTALPTMVACAAVGGDGGTLGPVTVPVGFQVNDTGLGWLEAAGPAQSIEIARETLRGAGGLPDMLSLNFVGGATCSPCDAGVCCH
jgi:hypothetical protein